MILALVTATTLLTGALVVGGAPVPASAAADETVFGATATWKVPTSSYSALDESRGLLFVAPGRGRVVTVIDTKTGKKRAALTVPKETGPMAASATNGLLYIAEPNARRLTAVKSLTGATAFRVSLPSYSSTLVVDDSAGIIWVVDRDVRTVSARSAITGALIGDPISTGDYVLGAAVDESTHDLYVAGNKSLVVIDGTSHTVTRTMPSANPLGQVVIDPTANTVFAAGAYGIGVARVTSEGLSWILPDARMKSIALDPTSNDLLLFQAEQHYMTRLLSVDRETGESKHWVDTQHGDDIIVGAKSGVAYYTDVDTAQVTVLTKGHRPRILATPKTTGVRATVPYSTGPLKTSGTKPLVWTLEGNTSNGITINSRTGEVHGTFAAKGEYSFVARVSNSFGIDLLPFTFSVDVPPQSAPVFGKLKTTYTPLHGRRYGASLGLTGYPVPKLTAKKLPEGLRLSQDGFVSGTLKKVGKQSFTITATNKYGTASHKYTLAVTGAGTKSGGIFMMGKETKLDGMDRKSIRDLVRSMPKHAVVTSADITASAAVVHGDKAAAVKKARKRAYSIASYFDHLGVKLHPKYTLSTGKAKQGEHYFYSDFRVRYTYK